MKQRRFFWPMIGFGFGSGLMTAVYFGIVSAAEGPEHAASFFREELRFILPLIAWILVTLLGIATFAGTAILWARQYRNLE